ncbi:MAG: protein BatD [Ferruginibacter sp.]|nr:protein BatD [Ferruginibacter sp.]
MVNYLHKLFLLSVLLPILSWQTLLAQVRFTATISPATIGKNETAELRLMIENARQVDQIIPPSFKDFIVLSGPNQESGMENNNGVTKQYIGITYVLKPKAKGNFNIGAAVAKADGKTLKTNTVKLQVTNAATTGNQQSASSSPFGNMSSLFDDPPVQQTNNTDFILKKGENVQAKIDKNLFIKVTLDKTSCYIGEPIVVTYKLYTRLKSESSVTKNPSLNGFSVIDLTQPGSNLYDIEKLNGREYNVYTLRKAQLYPLQAGTMEVEMAEVENTVHFIKGEYLKSHAVDLNDVLNGAAPEAIQDEKVTIQSKPVAVNVKSLPDTNKPASFKGAVGNFKIEAGVEKNNFTTDDAGKLQVVVSGQGNMELINAPEVSWPDSIENFEPTVTEALNKQVVPVSGSKSFEYAFTIKKPGTYTLPAIEYSYFDVALGTYKTIATQPITINIKKGTGKHTAPTNTEFVKTGKEHFFDALFGNRLFIIVPVALLIFAGLFFWIKKENKKEYANAVIAKDKEVKAIAKVQASLPVNPLAITENKLVQHDSRGFYEALNKELRQFLAIKLAVPVQTINKKTIGEELDKKGISVNISLQIQQLINEVEWQLYTPFADENKMDKMYQSATNIVHSFPQSTEA